MYYKSKENEYLRCEYIGKAKDLWIYEVQLAIVPSHLIQALKVFKMYTALYPQMEDTIAERPSLRLLDHQGALMHVPYKKYVMRAYTHHGLITRLKTGEIVLTCLSDD